MKHNKRLLILVAALLLTAGLSGCSPQQEETSSLPAVSTADLTVFAEGTSVAGKNLSGKTLEDAIELCEKEYQTAKDELVITVTFENDTISLSAEDFSWKEVLTPSLEKLLEDRIPGEFPLPYVVDLSDSGEQKIKEMAKNYYTPGKDAAVESYDGSSGKFTFTKETKGKRVDLPATLQSVRELLAQKHGGAIQAAFTETDPELTAEYLQNNFKLISTYSTVSSNSANGNSNMALALSHVNGTLLAPNQTFSYNSTIGDSTDPSAGWLPAGGLLDGLLVQMYGGGICQGSTTLYNAALLAGMEITVRDCHSSPSTYCPIGLDATVDYGNIDFCFRNPFDTPVYIAAWMDGVTLHCSFFGCPQDEWDRIEVGSEQTGYEAPLTTVKFKEDAALKKGEYVRTSTGNSGYSAEAWRIYYKGDKEVKRESLPSSYYAPSGIVYKVGPGTEVDKVDKTKESGTTDPSPSPSPTVSPTPTPQPSEVPTPAPSVSEEPTPTEPPEEEEPTPTPDIGGDDGNSSLITW